MNSIELLGLVAAALTTGSSLPQVLRLWRTRKAVLMDAMPVVLANAVTLILAVAVVVLVVRIRAAGRRAAPGD